MIWKLLKRSITTEPDPALSPRFDPDDPAFVENPYPCFSQLRDREPLHLSDQGAWVLSRYEDIVSALADKRLGNEPAYYAVLNQKNREKYICADVANNTLPFLEGDSHKRLRHVIAPLFLSFVRGGVLDLEGLAAEVLDELGDQESLDLLHDFATPLSLKVLCRILGFPEQDGVKLKAWSDAFFYLFAPMPAIAVREQTDQALSEFRDYVAEHVEQAKSTPGNDLISALLEKRNSGDENSGFSDSELIDNCMLIFADGIGNVDAGIANMLALLLQNPQQLEQLSNNPDLLSAAVDEALRMETPGQFIARVATQDIQWHGQQIKQNQAVFLLLGSANRDEFIFPQANEFQLTRPNSREALSFGKGSHTCVGAHLVRLEMQAALKVLLQSYSVISLREKKLQWRQRRAHRWLQSLPVRVAKS
ncbi:MAG: hypothetical protein CMP91_01965 [Gammaproteobacteria bacterium]|nr:hypothetical protein [Gammaproteobacteria bacterium]MAY03222.1 hypothetical protein [Gammaproteobacteria bacterium]|tara:strand:- start:437 stop:1696 length:1260 start_codon:yes stop_codon:yes gene_type:complete